jgi:hypothetical protein
MLLAGTGMQLAIDFESNLSGCSRPIPSPNDELPCQDAVAVPAALLCFMHGAGHPLDCFLDLL